jgi:peptidoglycan/LPS O-acetylase OafA/YrhL
LAGWLRFLCVGPLLWFGRISYSLYLVHENIGFVIMLKAHEAGLGHWAGFSLAFVSVIAIAWVLNMLVEKPGARMIAMWWKQRKSKDGLQPNYAVQPLS